MDIKKYRHEIEFLILVIAILLIWYLGRHFYLDTDAIHKYLARFPLFYSAILFILLYVIVTFFVWFSKDLFWLMAALLFGAAFSTLFICIAETINAYILFYLARRLGRAYVEKSAKGRYKDLDEKLGKISFPWLFIFRGAPLIPYRFLDLAAGLTSIDFRKYIAAVILGSPFKMFWIQYILVGVGRSIFGNPMALVDYFLRNKTLFAFSLIYPLLVIAVAFKIGHKD